jgi:hypothetical protein
MLSASKKLQALRVVVISISNLEDSDINISTPCTQEGQALVNF